MSVTPDDLRSALRSLGRGVMHGAELVSDALEPLLGAFAARARDGRTLLFILAALVFLVITIVGIGADSSLAAAMNGLAVDDRRSIWIGWLPAPLAWLALALALAEAWSTRRSLPLLIPALALGAWMAALRFINDGGALSWLAYREANDQAVILLAAFVLWALARRDAALALAVWMASLAVIFLARLLLPGPFALLRPDVMPLLFSLALGLYLAGSFWKRLDAATADDETRPFRGMAREFSVPRSGGSPFFSHSMAWLGGAGLAWACARRLHPAEPLWSEVRQAMGLLWSRSVLLGWGRMRLLRMTNTALEPAAMHDVPTWLGPVGSGGSAGFIGLIGGAILALALASWAASRASDENGRPRAGTLFLPALLAVEALLGLSMVGGPSSMIPLLLVSGWLALAAADAGEDGTLTPGAFRSIARVAAGAISLFIFAGLVALGFGPAWSRSILAGIGPDDLKSPKLKAKLERAQWLDSENPRALAARAAWLREQLTQSPNWDEATYQKICSAYEQASRLDPWDSAIPLRLAEVQTLARRPADAARTIDRALARMPANLDLAMYGYLQGAAEGRVAAVQSMIRRALTASPESGVWWMRRHALELASGRGEQAGEALGVAMTSLSGAPRTKAEAALEGQILAAAFDRARQPPALPVRSAQAPGPPPRTGSKAKKRSP